MSEKLKLQNYIRPELELPNNQQELLLHSCCAPCSGEIIEALASSNIKTTVYFFPYLLKIMIHLFEHPTALMFL